MKVMTHDEIYEAINELGNGRFFRLSYMTDVNVKKEAKSNGYMVKKITTTTTRTGVKYTNINGVVPSGKTSKGETMWELPNKVKYNLNTNKSYLVVAPIKNGSNSRVVYYVFKDNKCVDNLSKSELVERYSNLFNDSFFAKHDAPVVMNITMDNIMSVGGTK